MVCFARVMATARLRGIVSADHKRVSAAELYHGADALHDLPLTLRTARLKQLLHWNHDALDVVNLLPQMLKQLLGRRKLDVFG